MSNVFFPLKSESRPMIYAYSDSNPMYAGLLKIGFTAVDVDKRVAQQYPICKPGEKPYNIVFRAPAMYIDGSSFTDHEIHKYLKKHGFKNPAGEWFKCTVKDVKAAWLAVSHRIENDESRTEYFSMRPEQEAAVEKTIDYFKSAYAEDSNRTPKFLWNAKMRFGKTFAAYQLAKRMGFKRVLILTFKPAVQNAWKDDLLHHIDFEGWQFIYRDGLKYEDADKNKPIVCFGSFQDYLGVNPSTGGIKPRNEWVHTENWDLVIFDEYHFGAWKETAKKLFEQEDEDSFDSVDLNKYDRANAYDETFLPITTMYYLFLSGTPFRALNSGEFIEEQIYNWTYSDEQRAKKEWPNLSMFPNYKPLSGETNPYESLPRMVMMTYKIPDSIRKVAMQGEFNEFDLNVFFSATGKGKEAKFVYENEVQKWLDLIRGAYLETTIDELKLKGQRALLPFKDTSLLQILNHTLWFLPNVASCFAMKNLLSQKQNVFYHDYKINLCAGPQAGIGVDALYPVLDSMENPLESKTITLSCGKLTTGVTIRPWTGIFMLRNLSSPETYFQSAFRVQSPWVIDSDGGKKEIVKKECYIFDFALDRALKQISDYSCRLNVGETNPESKVAEFIRFLPVLAFDGSSMQEINASDVLDIAMAGTSATLLARRWESALLVNVDNITLQRLMNNKEAMDALMKIEGFRSLNKDISTIIAKSEKVKKAKKEKDQLTKKEKAQLTEEEKEYKSMRKQIQEKLIKFATRVPIFMYLSDYRERSLEDVITKLEPELFKKVTGLSVTDFNLLVSLGVFNGSLMNDAVYKFKRYEDSSLSYTGVDRHVGEDIGLFNTVISNYEFYNNLQKESLVREREVRYSTPRSKLEEDELNSYTVVNETRVNIVTSTDVEPQGEKIAIVGKKEVKSFDPSEVDVGSVVIHKAFGEGVVKSINYEGGTINVAFGKNIKMFQFPGGFVNGFLELKK